MFVRHVHADLLFVLPMFLFIITTMGGSSLVCASTWIPIPHCNTTSGDIITYVSNVTEACAYYDPNGPLVPCTLMYVI